MPGQNTLAHTPCLRRSDWNRVLLARSHGLIAVCPFPLARGTPSIDKSMTVSQFLQVSETISTIFTGVGEQPGWGGKRSEFSVGTGTFDSLCLISRYFNRDDLGF